MPNPIVLEILENERDTITRAINILKYGGTGQKRRGRPPKLAQTDTPVPSIESSNGHLKKRRKLSPAGERRRMAGYRRWKKQRAVAEKD